jgi:hypothetical protein
MVVYPLCLQWPNAPDELPAKAEVYRLVALARVAPADFIWQLQSFAAIYEEVHGGELGCKWACGSVLDQVWLISVLRVFGSCNPIAAQQALYLLVAAVWASGESQHALAALDLILEIVVRDCRCHPVALEGLRLLWTLSLEPRNKVRMTFNCRVSFFTFPTCMHAQLIPCSWLDIAGYLESCC